MHVWQSLIRKPVGAPGTAHIFFRNMLVQSEHPCKRSFHKLALPSMILRLLQVRKASNAAIRVVLGSCCQLDTMGRVRLLSLGIFASCTSVEAFVVFSPCSLQDTWSHGGNWLSSTRRSGGSCTSATGTTATAQRFATQEAGQGHHVHIRRPALRHSTPKLSMSTPDASAPSSPPSAEAVPAATGPETIVKPGSKITNEWELDVYSRPVIGADGKKLWELLICDSTGNLRHVSPIPSNMVNSREVRKTIETVIDSAPGGSKPTVIRFFRNAMFNMIDIALRDVEIAVKPCRTTYAMYQWLEERERDVYPNMTGYKATMKQPAFMDIRTPTPLPDALRGEQYAFVGMPVSEFRNGNINDDNVGVGRLCPLDASLPDDAMIPGLAMFTTRAEPLATWMTGLEVAYFKADLKNRELALECGINTQYLVARVVGDQRKEAQNFEETKRALGGFHFVAVQNDADADDVAGFWLLKEVAM